MKRARAVRVEVKVWWVPSHDKPWRKRLPPAEVGMELARKLNDKADTECEQLLKSVVKRTRG